MNKHEIRNYEDKIRELERLRAIQKSLIDQNNELKTENLKLKNQVENQKRELEKCLHVETVI